MTSRLARFAAAQSPEEIARQYSLLKGAWGFRSGMTVLLYLVAAIFVPFWVITLAAAFDLAGERQILRWLKDLIPAENPRAYLGTLALTILIELAVALIAARAFLEDTSFSKAFAIGIVNMTLLQLASNRTIHLPYALCGLATLYLTSLVTAIIYWWGSTDAVGFLAALICLLASGYFTFTTMTTNHKLHAGMARGRTEAQAANETKSRFLAQMSHELRTPLNAILGLSHAEQAQTRAPQSHERLGLIVDAARGLGVILDDILDMSAIQAGQMPIRPAPARLRDEIHTAMALYRPLFHAADLQLTLTLPLATDLPEVAIFDAQRLRQCLSNLLSNALKHTRQGGADITASLTPTGLLAIEIADTGPGIAEAERVRIFEPFQRALSAQPGSGLGLSISRAFARAMGGDLQLLPSASGARFVLTLAIIATDTQPAQDPPTLPDYSGLRILVVDDISTNRIVAAAYLRLFAITVESAASGAEALGMITANPPDLVLLDMNMPDMDGLSTLKRIRTLPSRAAQVPVVAMTADVTAADRTRYLGAGMDGYLAKPLTPEGVADILARHLKRS